MRRLHATLIATLLGGAAAAGAAAALRTVHVGVAASVPTVARVPDAVVTERRRKLEHWAASLAKARSSRPPALPAVPHFAPVVVPTVPSAPPVAAPSIAVSRAASPPARKRVVAAPAPATVVVRQAPAPAQTTTHSSPAAGEHEDGEEHEGYGDGGDD